MKKTGRFLGLVLIVAVVMGLFSFVPSVGATSAAGKTYTVGDLSYDPTWVTYEQWKTAIPDLEYYEVKSSGNYTDITRNERNLFIRLTTASLWPDRTTVREGQIFILDLNGCGMYFQGYYDMMDVKKGGTLIILDSLSAKKSVSGEGFIKAYECAGDTSLSTVSVKGNLILLSGSIVGQTNCIGVEDGAKVMIHGGTIVKSAMGDYNSKGSPFRYFGNQETGIADVSIYGGAVIDRFIGNPLVYDNKTNRVRIMMSVDSIRYGNGQKMTPPYQNSMMEGTLFFGEASVMKAFGTKLTPSKKKFTLKGSIYYLVTQGKPITADMRYLVYDIDSDRPFSKALYQERMEVRTFIKVGSSDSEFERADTKDIIFNTVGKDSITVEYRIYRKEDADTDYPRFVYREKLTVQVEEDTSEPVVYEKGDINGDGSVDITDAMLLFYHVAKKELLSEELLTRAELTGDGLIDITDAMNLFYFVAKKIPSL